MYILQGEFKKLIASVCLVACLYAEHWLCFVNGLLVDLFKQLHCWQICSRRWHGVFGLTVLILINAIYAII